jgi:hypothetical protein
MRPNKHLAYHAGNNNFELSDDPQYLRDWLLEEVMDSDGYIDTDATKSGIYTLTESVTTKVVDSIENYQYTSEGAKEEALAGAYEEEREALSAGQYWPYGEDVETVLELAFQPVAPPTPTDAQLEELAEIAAEYIYTSVLPSRREIGLISQNGIAKVLERYHEMQQNK